MKFGAQGVAQKLPSVWRRICLCCRKRRRTFKSVVNTGAARSHTLLQGRFARRRVGISLRACGCSEPWLQPESCVTSRREFGISRPSKLCFRCLVGDLRRARALHKLRVERPLVVRRLRVLHQGEQVVDRLPPERCEVLPHGRQGGLKKAASGRSSNPTTDTSSGTRRPHSRSARSARAPSDRYRRPSR